MNNMLKKLNMDYLRVLAALLVVAIHVYPFLQINNTLEILFTHVFCRIAVPIFLMITGYFVLPTALNDRSKLVLYTKKILKIYLFSILLYLPINIYSHSFAGFSIIDFLKSIFIDGTFYHLWYFPGLILGIWLTYFLVKKIPHQVSIIVIILYLIGLFGDSYYGLVSSITIIKDIYHFIFNIFSYTRNGLFYMPIFIYLGYKFHQNNFNISKKSNFTYLTISLILMLIEGYLLYSLDLVRHDSMYLFLIPTMFCIFNWLLQLDKSSNKLWRNIGTDIYIIHPLVIIGLRLIAKIIHLESLLIENNLIQYILVIIISLVVSLCFEKGKEIIQNEKGKRVIKN